MIVGDVDPRTTLARVEALFGAIPTRPTPERKPVVLTPFKAQTIARTTPVGTGSVQFLFRMPGQMSKDNAAAQVLLDVLNNPRSGLSELAAQGKVLSADADIQPFSQGGIGQIEVGFSKGADPREAQAHLDGAIAALVKDGVSPDLVDAAKRSELAQFEFSKNSAVSLASAWSQALAWQGLQSPEEAQQQIQRVTVGDVDRIARDVLRPDARVTVVLTPDPNGKRPPNSAGFGGTESFAGDDKLDVPLPEWATKALGSLKVPHWTLDPAQMQLPNGITLIVQPETVSKTVTVVGHVDHNAGLQEPAGQEGVGRLLAALFDYGSTSLDRSAFHKALDAIAADESGGDEFSLAVPSADFDRGMQLLADNELQSGAAASRHSRSSSRRSRARWQAKCSSPDYRTSRAVREGLLPGRGFGLARSDSRDRESPHSPRRRHYFASTYRPDVTTIVVVGDVTAEQARDERREILRRMESARREARRDSAPGAGQSSRLHRSLRIRMHRRTRC